MNIDKFVFMFIKKLIHLRFLSASKVAVLHLASSIAIALVVAAIIFFRWYPYPFGELADERDIFILFLTVDVICGPLLTLILFNPAKSHIEFVLDLSLVVAIQIFTLGYGVHIVSQIRPLFLVQEIDRFKVVMAPDLANGSLTLLPSMLKPNWYLGPITVAIREPKDAQERNKVMFESVQGGRDYAERQSSSKVSATRQALVSISAKAARPRRCRSQTGS